MFKAYIPLLILASAASVFASTTTSSTSVSNCAAGSLSSYVSSYAPASLGCSIGVLDYSNFTYSAISNAPAASNILLTPTTDGFSFTQASGQPFVANGDVMQFAIYYNIFIDPAPVIVGARNSLDPPAGDVNITEYFCNDAILYPGTTSCFPPTTAAYSLTVTTASPTNSITFGNPARVSQTVGIVFTLDGTNGVASFDGLDSGTAVQVSPEPASFLLVGLVVAAGGYKLRKRAN